MCLVEGTNISCVLVFLREDSRRCVWWREPTSHVYLCSPGKTAGDVFGGGNQHIMCTCVPQGRQQAMCLVEGTNISCLRVFPREDCRRCVWWREPTSHVYLCSSGKTAGDVFGGGNQHIMCTCVPQGRQQAMCLVEGTNISCLRVFLREDCRRYVWWREPTSHVYLCSSGKTAGDVFGGGNQHLMCTCVPQGRQQVMCLVEGTNISCLLVFLREDSRRCVWWREPTSHVYLCSSGKTAGDVFGGGNQHLMCTCVPQGRLQAMCLVEGTNISCVLVFLREDSRRCVWWREPTSHVYLCSSGKTAGDMFGGGNQHLMCTCVPQGRQQAMCLVEGTNISCVLVFLREGSRRCVWWREPTYHVYLCSPGKTAGDVFGGGNQHIMCTCVPQGRQQAMCLVEGTNISCVLVFLREDSRRCVW